MPAEANVFHNRLQKVALAVEESRIYWQYGGQEGDPARESLRAFEKRWFGAKTLQRVRVLMADFRARYAAYPESLAVLREWRDMNPVTRRLICHWHLQLSDPLYRSFTGSWLVDRREVNLPVDFHSVLRWAHAINPRKWSPATCRQVASKLLSAGSEAGLISVAPDPRRPLTLHVPDEAVEYLLYLLRGVRISGSLLENEYLASVGLFEVPLNQRGSAVSPLRVHRLGGVTEIEWTYESLQAWAEASL